MISVRKAICVALLLMVTAVHAQDLSVTEVRVQSLGEGAADESFVRAYVSVETGQKLDAIQVSRDIRKLLATQRFSDVRVEVEESTGGIALIYIVHTRQRLAEAIRITGGKHLKAEKIRDLLEIERGDRVDETSLAVAGRKVADEYREDGYPFIKLDWSIDPVADDEGTAIVNLVVDEGKRVALRGTTFTGNQNVSPRSLRRVVGGLAWWNPMRLFGRRKPGQDQLELDKDAIRLAYLERGFLDVTIGEPRQVVSKSGRYTVEFPVNEGDRYELGEVSFAGVTLFKESELERQVTITPGEFVSVVELQRSAQNVRSYYTSQGYLRTTVRQALSCRKSGESGEGVVDITYTVSEGSLTHVRNIFIRGNRVTKEKVIRRELAIYPGEELDERSLRKSERRLRNLGYFANVTTHTEETPKLDEYDLAFEVEEQRTGTFMIGGGFSSIENLVGFIEVTEGNFDIGSWPPKGAGQKLKLRGQFGGQTTVYELSFVEPWFRDKKLSVGFDLYSTKKRYSDYDLERTGGRIRVGKPLRTPFFSRADITYTLEDVHAVETDTNVYFMTDESGLAMTNTYSFESQSGLNSSLSLRLTHEARDSFFFPTRGNRVVANGQVSGGILGGDLAFYELGLKGEQYFPMWRDHVVALRGLVRVVDDYDDTDVQLSYRMFPGGGRSIRGFEYRDVGPKVINANGSYRAIGGKTMITGTAEYIVPVVEKIRLAAFADTGNAWEDAYEVSFDRMATSAGVELRFDIPQFPIRINYSWILGKDSEATDEQRWGFWLGSGF